MIKSNTLALYKQKNGWYRSTKISIEKLIELCGNKEYIWIVAGDNPYKKHNDNRPEKIFFIVCDI